MRAFKVYLNEKLIDTIFYADDSTEDEVSVYNSLVYHDGYDSLIEVEEEI